ncbi:MAG: Na/Pi cotransporter family protein, partial [Ignavibacteriae bacterium]
MITKLLCRKWLMLILVLISLIQPLAAMDSGGSIHWVMLTFSLLGGLALFLFGMEQMSEGMKKTTGDKMRTLLSALTKNRLIGMTVGAFVTMVIQSSSATTVMLVSFVQAQLMTFVQSLGVILGADIGTTITAQLIAFKLTDYALIMIAIGFAVRMFSKKDTGKHIGEVIMGFGILIFGMILMSDAMIPLRTYTPFIELLKGLENPLLGLLVGAVFT